MGERVTLSASGREKMGYTDPGGGDDNGGNANGNYTPPGSNIDGPVKPENKPKKTNYRLFNEAQSTEYRMGTRVGAEGPGSFIGDADSTMGSALGAALRRNGL